MSRFILLFALGVIALILAACNNETTSGKLTEQAPKITEAAVSGTVVEMRWEFHPESAALLQLAVQLAPEAQTIVVQAVGSAHLVYAKAIDNSDAKTLNVVGDLKNRTLEWSTQDRVLDPTRFQAFQTVLPELFEAIEKVAEDENMTERAKWQLVTAMFQAIIPGIVGAISGSPTGLGGLLSDPTPTPAPTVPVTPQ